MQLSLHVTAGADADPVEIEEISRNLVAELDLLDVDEISPKSVVAPAGSKPGDAATWETIIVTLGASGGVLAELVGAVGEWLSRRERDVAVTVEIGGDKLSLSHSTESERKQLIDAFVQRHRRP